MRLDTDFSLKEIPRLREGEHQKGTALCPTENFLKDSEKSRIHIRKNLKEYKARIVDNVVALLRTSPPKLPTGVPPLTAADREEIANKVADAYIRAVDDFLRTRPGARPRQGQRSALADATGAQNEFNTPWCADWANYILGDEAHIHETFFKDSQIRMVFAIEGGQYNSRGRQKRLNFQHNWVVIFPRGYDPWKPKDANAALYLDPWYTIAPDSFTPAEHSAKPYSHPLTDRGIQ